jgi:hypothetical protein
VKYRKKPVEVDGYPFNPQTRAVEWLSNSNPSLDEYDLVLDQIEADYPDTDLTVFGWSFDDGFTISTLEGRMHVSPGDVVLRGVSGEFYPCKPDIFEATYDAL